MRRLGGSPVSWYALAPCNGVDPELFFRARDRDRALALCEACPYTEACLEDEFAFAWKTDGIHGVRAGMTEEERRVLFRARFPDQRERARAGAWYYELTPA